MSHQQEIKTVAVIGAGLMGHGIAQEFASAGYRVHLTDSNKGLLGRVHDSIRENLQAVAELGKSSPLSSDDIIDAIVLHDSLETCVATADYVVEAVFENLELKQTIFGDIDQYAPSHAIVASNSSSFMPSQIAVKVRDRGRVLVAHYFNPPFAVPLVELVRGPETSDSTIEAIENLYRNIGKTPVVVQKEAPGFIGNRLQMALLREALAIVESGIAVPQDVDAVISNSIGRRWAVAGVFEVFDLAGLDLLLAVASQIQPDLESSRDVSPVLKNLVASGGLGAKSGHGFYDWTPESIEEAKSRIRRNLISMSGSAPK